MRAAIATCVWVLACGDSPAPAPAPTPPPAPPDAAVIAAPNAVDDHDAAMLGALHFDISGGTPAARARFDRGLLALHSFWYDEATRQFQLAIDADKTFAMAYWGLAMSKAKLLWADDDLEGGRAALQRMPSPQTLPPRDQAWVMAAVSLFRRATLDIRASRKDFLVVMEQLHAKFPDDESALFLAIALLATIRPDDPEEPKIRERAGELAETVRKRNPRHPGAAHYVIHAYDTVALAPRALAVAQDYAKIAPAAFHARHMPAHIFVRLGDWKPAATSCQAAWDASVAWVKRDKLVVDRQDFHSLAWLVEIGFERGRRGDADRALGLYAEAVRSGLGPELRAAFANQVASYLARTGDWKRTDELLAPLQSPAGTGAAAGLACGHAAPAGGPPTQLFERRAVLGTRAAAAAHLRDPATLARVLDERDKVDAELRPFVVATQPADFVASVDKLRGFVRKALEARARGDDRAMIAALQPLAVDQERGFTGEGLATGTLHREDIAEARARLGDARGALADYKLVLGQHAGRARSLLGAARAAAKLGDRPAARGFYEKLLSVWSEADVDLDGVAEARAAIR